MRCFRASISYYRRSAINDGKTILKAYHVERGVVYLTVYRCGIQADFLKVFGLRASKV